jgi:hypothetical protein
LVFVLLKLPFDLSLLFLQTLVLIHESVLGRCLGLERFVGNEFVGLEDSMLALELKGVLEKFVHVLTLLVGVSVTWSRVQLLTKSGLDCH